MLPDLNRLNVFYQVYTRLSITAAAGRLHITPSAVSQQLKKLEREIKTPLFTRLHKRLVPTPNGKRLFRILDPLAKNLAEGMRALEKGRAEPTGVLKIGAPVEFGGVYLPYVMATFRNRYANVTFSLELGRPSALLPKVKSAELDFAFVDTFPARGRYMSDFVNFSVTPVIEEEVVLACSKNFDASCLDHDHCYENLAGQAFISQQPDAGALNNWFRHHFGKTPHHLRLALTVASHQAVVSAVRHHLGLGIIVSHLVWKEIQSGDIVVIRKEADQAVNRIAMVQLQDKVPTLAEKSFIAHFHQAARQSKALKHLVVH